MLLMSLLACNQYEMFRLAGYEQASFSNDADIVFIIDNSSSMTDEAVDLAENFDVFVDQLTSTEGGRLPQGDLSQAVDAYVLYTSQRGRFIDYNMGITTTSVEIPGGNPNLPGTYGGLVGTWPVIDPSFEDVEGTFKENLLCEATCWDENLIPSDVNYDSDACEAPEQMNLQYLDCLCGLEEWEGNCGSGDEEHLEAAFMAMCRAVEDPPDDCLDGSTPFTSDDIMSSPGLLRGDATVIFVIVSDEGDGSRRLVDNDEDPTLYLELLDQFGVNYKFAIIGPAYDKEAGSLACNSGGATTYGSERLQIVAEESGGFYRHIAEKGAGGDCQNSDFATHLEELGALLNELLVSFPLQSVPDVSTLLVYVDGQEIPGGEVNLDTGEVDCDCWTYDPSENSIMFHNAAIPDYNQDVEIFYEPLEGMPRQLPF